MVKTQYQFQPPPFAHSSPEGQWPSGRQTKKFLPDDIWVAGVFLPASAHTRREVIQCPAFLKIRAQFESMPIDLKTIFMDAVKNMNDLMGCPERIVAEGEVHA